MRLRVVRRRSHPEQIDTDSAMLDDEILFAGTVKQLMEAHAWIEERHNFFNPRDILSWIYASSGKLANIPRFHWQEVPLNLTVSWFEEFDRLGLIKFDKATGAVERTYLGWKYYFITESIFVDRLPKVLTEEARADLSYGFRDVEI